MSPQRRPTARELLTRQSEHILATRYAGQVRAVVIERALQRMTDADERRERKAGMHPGRGRVGAQEGREGLQAPVSRPKSAPATPRSQPRQNAPQSRHDAPPTERSPE